MRHVTWPLVPCKRSLLKLKATSWRCTTLISTANFPGMYSKNSTGCTIGRAPDCRSILTAWRNTWPAFHDAARKDLRRKMRASHEVRVVRSRTIAPYLDRIYTLYLDTVARSPMALGAHNRLFFEKICERVPGAEYTLYFVQEELVAFNLLVVKQEAMMDIYFCMDHDLGRTYNLYVLSWLENVRTCVERNIPLYYAGQGTEKTKAHLGATLIPSFILFKHRQPVFDRFLMAWPAVSGKDPQPTSGFGPKWRFMTNRN